MRAWCAGAVVVVMCAGVARGGIAPDYDFQWAVIGDVGNAPYTSNPFSSAFGRGSVDHEYRISKLEITTAQWMEFMNTFPNEFPIEQWPSTWGAHRQGSCWVLDEGLSNPAMVPVNGVSWRHAAKYCNWLHNDKVPEAWAITNGAYDASTFTSNEDGTFNDQLTHSPDAKFWIPTHNEWLKAAHYDPDRYGEKLPGWWEYSHSSDTSPAPGRPGTPGAQTSAGIPFDGMQPFPSVIPLGSYPETRSPWGLLDLSGGQEEWMESALGQESRTIDGSAAGLSTARDRIGGWTYRWPLLPNASFRIASAVPAPGVTSLIVCMSMIGLSRDRRKVAANSA